MCVTRKCNDCKQPLSITEDNVDEVIYYDKKTYHSSCFVDLCTKRASSKRKDIHKKWSDILDNLYSIRNESNTHLLNEIYKGKIFQLIQDNYDVSVVPSVVWHKLSAIYTGTFYGMSQSISPFVLYDMWTRKLPELKAIANRNITKGKGMDTTQLIKYDLSILINKYDSYMAWKEKQKILQTSAVERESNEELYTKNISSIVNQKPSKANEMNDIVDDIFDI